MRYQFIAAQSTLYPVLVLCRVMRVARSGYYAYRQRSVQPPAPDKVELARQVKACFLAHRRRYGTRRLRAELKAQGLALGRYRVRTLMRDLGLQAIQPKRFVPQTTDSRQTRMPSPNLLRAADNQASAPQQVVVGDITYLPLQNGKWCYLAMWQDRCTKQIVGWAVESRMTEALVIKALTKAAHGGHLKAHMIIHTDQGSQYAATSFRALLKRYELRQSMSRKGNCYDNGVPRISRRRSHDFLLTAA